MGEGCCVDGSGVWGEGEESGVVVTKGSTRRKSKLFGSAAHDASFPRRLVSLDCVKETGSVMDAHPETSQNICNH